MRKFSSVRDLAALFSKHENTIYTWLDEGLFPNAFKVKGLLYIPQSDIDRLRRQGRARTEHRSA